MKYITLQEFDAMYRELYESDFTCYDSLMFISDKVLRNYVRKRCYHNPALKGRQYEDDIMQEIKLRLLKTCVNGFFMRGGKENYDPQGFVAWILEVASNIICDFAKKVRRYQFNEVKGIDDCFEIPYQNDLFSSVEACDKLNVAFEIVIDSDIKIYKVLTWVAMMVFMINLNIEKIDSNDVIVNTFTSMTLYDMYALIISQAKRIVWLSLDDKRMMSIKRKLDAKQKDGRRLGEMLYGEFYMKKGPKSTISDWINRVNKFILKEEQKNVAFDS